MSDNQIDSYNTVLREMCDDEKLPTNCNLLPPEVMEKIFTRLDTRDVLTCSQVCKKWRSICERTNPLLMPKVLGTVYRHLNRSRSLLQARAVCKLWKLGVDELTARDALTISGQSFICFQRNDKILRKPDSTNPFPSRIVRMTVALHEWASCMDSVPEMAVIRAYGSNIKILNIKIIAYSVESHGLENVVRVMAIMLTFLDNLQGLSINITAVFSNGRFPGFRKYVSVVDSKGNNSIEQLNKDISIPQMRNLKSLRLVAWNFASEMTEWLYYEILRHSPNLELFDPDYYKGYEKFFTIFSEPKLWPFNLSFIKLAVPGSASSEFFKLIREAKFPIKSIYLDIFGISCDWEKHEYSKLCHRILHTAIKNCEGTLRTLALGFYLTSKYLPLTPISEAHPVVRRSRTVPDSSETRSCSFLRRAHRTCYLENLKLIGFTGSLNFLKDFKSLKRLILLDYHRNDQNIFSCQKAFFQHIPTLRDLHTPHFGTLDARTLEWNMIDRQFLPLYW